MGDQLRQRITAPMTPRGGTKPEEPERKNAGKLNRASADLGKLEKARQARDHALSKKRASVIELLKSPQWGVSATQAEKFAKNNNNVSRFHALFYGPKAVVKFDDQGAVVVDTAKAAGWNPPITTRVETLLENVERIGADQTPCADLLRKTKVQLGAPELPSKKKDRLIAIDRPTAERKKKLVAELVANVVDHQGPQARIDSLKAEIKALKATLEEKEAELKREELAHLPTKKWKALPRGEFDGFVPEVDPEFLAEMFLQGLQDYDHDRRLYDYMSNMAYRLCEKAAPATMKKVLLQAGERPAYWIDDDYLAMWVKNNPDHAALIVNCLAECKRACPLVILQRCQPAEIWEMKDNIMSAYITRDEQDSVEHFSNELMAFAAEHHPRSGQLECARWLLDKGCICNTVVGFLAEMRRRNEDVPWQSLVKGCAFLPANHVEAFFAELADHPNDLASVVQALASSRSPVAAALWERVFGLVAGAEDFKVKIDCLLALHEREARPKAGSPLEGQLNTIRNQLIAVAARLSRIERTEAFGMLDQYDRTLRQDIETAVANT